MLIKIVRSRRLIEFLCCRLISDATQLGFLNSKVSRKLFSNNVNFEGQLTLSVVLEEKLSGISRVKLSRNRKRYYFADRTINSFLDLTSRKNQDFLH